MLSIGRSVPDPTDRSPCARDEVLADPPPAAVSVRRSRAEALNASIIVPGPVARMPLWTSTEMSLMPGGIRKGVLRRVFKRHVHKVAEDRRGVERGLRAAAEGARIVVTHEHAEREVR